VIFSAADFGTAVSCGDDEESLTSALESSDANSTLSADSRAWDLLRLPSKLLNTVSSRAMARKSDCLRSECFDGVVSVLPPVWTVPHRKVSTRAWLFRLSTGSRM